MPKVPRPEEAEAVEERKEAKKSRHAPIYELSDDALAERAAELAAEAGSRPHRGQEEAGATPNLKGCMVCYIYSLACVAVVLDQGYSCAHFDFGAKE